ncbi:thermonuclease family protein [Nitrosococcus wardiae]|uniref:Nuclease-like protein n=1 Tax=Nitrosococcus wardiae TaxID=1814290 RepID=A0A4P7BYX2_9GAMM|nr:nuclease-like protein [Nitrosococcus wardiae]QBQ55393.1 nuclease-like protein [Nitrosococcus wardiae]
MKAPKIAAHSLFTLLVIFGFPAATIAVADITGYALVQDDGSLKVGRRTIHLYGIYIPQTPVTCRSFLQPRRCAPRAALALDFKIQGFVHCKEREIYQDGSINAVCHADYTSVSMGIDLAAYLLEQGWAVALPDAPFEYHVLEKIARHKGFGIWGFSEMIIR